MTAVTPGAGDHRQLVGLSAFLGSSARWSVAWRALAALVKSRRRKELVEASARRVAAELRVARYPMQRTLIVLRDAGSVASSEASGATGRFAADVYELRVPSGVLSPSRSAASSSSPPSESSSSPRVSGRSSGSVPVVEQLELLASD